MHVDKHKALLLAIMHRLQVTKSAPAKQVKNVAEQKEFHITNARLHKHSTAQTNETHRVIEEARLLETIEHTADDAR